MTKALYHEDAYIKTFQATIKQVGESGIVLDQSAFYPGGGGQPSDRGVLKLATAELGISKVRRNEGLVWHQFEGEAPEVGEEVEGILDWERRYQLMRVHTAMHILCGVIWRDYGASVTGGNMEPLRGRMDFEFETMQKELVHEIEEKINLEVAEGRHVKTAILPRDEAFEDKDQFAAEGYPGGPHR